MLDRSRQNALAGAASGLGADGEVRWVAGDVGVEADVRRLVDEVEGAWGAVDAVVNNAGIRAHGPIESLALRDWDAVLATVLTGAFLTTRATLPSMRERGWGRIVNIVGMSGQCGAAGRAPVVAAKSGLIGLTKACAHEADGRGVTVNADFARAHRHRTPSRPRGYRTLRNSTTNSSAIKAIPSAASAPLKTSRPWCRILCSDDAGYVTGQVMAVNGGAYM